MDTTTLTFEEFENQVMAAFEDWPLRCKDRGDGFYIFNCVGAWGVSGNYYLGQWNVESFIGNHSGKGETLEAAIADMNKEVQ